MSEIKNIVPEMDLLLKDEFYLFYEMMLQALKTDNVTEGVNYSLALLRKFLNSGNCVIYSKNDDGYYIYKISDTSLGELQQPVGCIINKTKPLTEAKKILNLELHLSDRLDNLVTLHIPVDNRDCILSIINVDNSKVLNDDFWNKLKDTVQIILKRASSYEKNTKAITTDMLTNLDNRNSYEMRLQAFNEADENLVIGVFDLFRLKYVNDNYTHSVGDNYIKKAAKILYKYWPKYRIFLNNDSTETYEQTGHCVYRIGGDEFILMTTVENEKLANIKAGLAADEVVMMDLARDYQLPLGLNYGIVTHKPGDSIKQTYKKADELMEEDKRNMYKRLQIERRH